MSAMDELRLAARTRTFGVVDADRRACVLHGYLLALEEMERRELAASVSPNEWCARREEVAK